MRVLRHHGRRLPEPHAERLVALLALLLSDGSGQAARVAANVLSERVELVHELVQ